ncbi:MAG: hypothetical protein Q8Q07_09355, partial [Dehalococcoidales bacterium]|nr:hypothetical protein [Dehalococcoidales bacterium]
NPALFKTPQESFFPNHPYTQPYCEKYIFSDSVILFSHDGSSESALKLIIYAWRLFQQFLAAGFPMRGAITYGDLYVNKLYNVFLGSAFIDAYKKEQEQDWIGAYVDSSVWKAHSDLTDNVNSPLSLLGFLFPEYNIPLKSGKSNRLRSLNWRFNLVVKLGTKSLFPQTKIEEINSKQRNALDYAKWIRSSRLAYISNTPPIEVRTFYVGHSSQKPPFDHGDEF